jgi:hypothetical protein
VHIAGEGYLALAVGTLRLVEGRRTLFVGEKRERAESVEGEGEEIGGWSRQHHEWLFETVSGAGGWKPGKDAKKDKARPSSSRTTRGPLAGTTTPSRNGKKGYLFFCWQT